MSNRLCAQACVVCMCVCVAAWGLAQDTVPLQYQPALPEGEPADAAAPVAQTGGTAHAGLADGMLGMRFWAVEAGFVAGDPGRDESLDPGPDLSAVLNVPLLDAVDFHLSASYRQRSGTRDVLEMIASTERDLSIDPATGTTQTVERVVYTRNAVERETDVSRLVVDAGAVIRLASAEAPVKPFIQLGGTYVYRRAETGGDAETGRDAGFSGGAGLEVRAGANAFVTPFVLHAETGDTADTRYGLRFVYAYAARQAFRLHAETSDEDGSIRARIGWMCAY